MTDPEGQALPPGHPARRAAASALWISAAGACLFTAFCWITTQAKAVRASSPWQDDPYDGVVSFTQFLVPALIVLTAVRATLWRRDEPQPLFRIHQLLRGALVATVLVAATVGTDGLAVAARADRPLWNDGTPWLVAALVPLAAAVAASLRSLRTAFRVLPYGDGRQSGDWLDELAVLVDALPARLGVALPEAVRSSLARFTRSAGEFVRGHVVASAASVSLLAGLLGTTAEAVGEQMTSPLLFLTMTFIGAGGFFAFCMISNTVLRIAVPPERRPPVPTPARRAAKVAVTAGSFALPASAVLRDDIMAVLGHKDAVGTPELLAAIVVVSALVTVAFAFGATLAAVKLTGGRR
jgi:hypothetical protein